MRFIISYIICRDKYNHYKFLQWKTFQIDEYVKYNAKCIQCDGTCNYFQEIPNITASCT